MLGQLPSHERTYHGFFLGPEIDPWYERLLSTPFVPSGEKKTGASALPLEHSLPVTIYVPQSSGLAYLAKRLQYLLPPYVYPFFRDFVNVSKYRELLPHASEQEISNPLPIALDAPMIHVTPLPDLRVWHERLLAGERPEHALLRDEGECVGLIPATNIFLEFSPLEHSEWCASAVFGFPRAIWIMDDRTQLVVGVLCTEGKMLRPLPTTTELVLT
jgi:hypothetical protein